VRALWATIEPTCSGWALQGSPGLTFSVTPDPSDTSQVAVYILDKQQGPFEITIGAIEATT
jgi:hypothetical protein